MWRILICVLEVGALQLGAGCTKANPAAKCADNGTCMDPNYPFCDVDGSVSGQTGACIAVMCSPGAFQSCTGGSAALVCDSTGTTYSHVPCINGCDQTTGCITCTANTHSCANGTATNCDANGTVSMESCALGCSTNDATRCTQLVPSNGLSTYYGLATPTDLDLGSGTLDLDTSMFDDGTGNITMLPSFDVAGPADGASLRVFVVRHLTLGDILMTSTTAQQAQGVGRAAAFLATGDIDVTGRVLIQTGAVSIAGCNGNPGIVVGTYRGGAGGGGFAFAGGAGGDAASGATGGAGGSASGDPELVPLRGGCPGSNGFAGGAIQLVTPGAIHVSGVINADGWGAKIRSSGGAGGGILLEGATVDLAATGKLLVRGGGGGAGPSSTAAAPVPPDDASSPPGGTCTPISTTCGAGGYGGSTANAGQGGGAPAATGAATGGGGGGGSRGRVRINTLDGTYEQAAGAIITGDLTAGVVGTI